MVTKINDLLQQSLLPDLFNQKSINKLLTTMIGKTYKGLHTLWCPSMARLAKTRRAIPSLAFIIVLGFTLTGCDGSSEVDDEDGGVVGTGIMLRGTASESAALASQTVEIKALSGEVSSAEIGSGSRFEATAVKGNGPWVLRTLRGVNEFRYSIAFDESFNNINSYSDVILRNWFAQADIEIDAVFLDGAAIPELPSKLEIDGIAQGLFSIVSLVLDSYGVSGSQLLNGDFAADNTGIDEYLDKNPVLLEERVIKLLLTDPLTKTQSKTLSELSLDAILDAEDLIAPGIPGSVRALGSAGDKITLVWQPAPDNVGVVGYRVFRDGGLVATTPYPVYTDTGLLTGTAYTYEVAAVDVAERLSARSIAVVGTTLAASDTQAPPPPSLLAELAVSTNRVDLIWGQTEIGDVAAFNLYRGSDNSAPELLVRVTDTFATDATVTAGVNYCYQVSAEDASGNESARSEILCVNTTSSTGGEVPPATDGEGVPALAGLTLPDIAGADCSQVLAPSTITENTILAASCYSVNQNLLVESFANLTISAGTILKFAQGTKLTVEQGASLTANGSPGSPVVLTGQQSVPGYWGGVVINRSNNPANLIRNTLIEYAGGADVRAGLVVFSSIAEKSRVRVENSLIRFSSRYGVSFPGLGTIIDSFTGNLITRNNRPAAFNLTNLRAVAGRNDLSGNDQQLIDVAMAAFDADLLIPDLGVPLRSNGLSMVNNARLDIAAGVEMRFLPGAVIYIEGEIHASGTLSKPVLLTAFTPSPGQWLGLVLSKSDNNVLENTIIEYAGEPDASRVNAANLYLDDSSIGLSNVRLSNGAAFGFFAEGEGAKFTAFDNVTVTENARTGSLPISALHTLSAGASFTGNNLDQVDISGSALAGVSALWHDAAVPYRFRGYYQILEGSVTVSPGVSILAGPETQFFVERNAYFNATGTANNPIVFSSDTPVSGAWGGLVIRSDDAMNQLDGVRIEFAGATTDNNPARANSGAVRLECSASTPATVGIANTDIIGSGSWGLYVEEQGCAANLGANVRFIDNVLGDTNI